MDERTRNRFTTSVPSPPHVIALRPYWGIELKASRTEFRCRWVGVCPVGGRQIAAPTRGDVGSCLVGAVTNGPPARFFAALRMTAQPCHPEECNDEGSHDCRWVGDDPNGGRQIAAPTRGDVGSCLVGAVTNGPPARFFAALRMTEIAKPNPSGLGFSIIVHCQLSIVNLLIPLPLGRC